MANRIALLLICTTFLLPSCRAGAQIHTVAITVDDLPLALGVPTPQKAAEVKTAKRVNKAILRALRRHRAPATGFVVEQGAEEIGLPVSTEILKQWTRPGFDLGNHLYSHPDVNTLSVDQAEQEIMRGESTFAPLLHEEGRHPEFLRFPYNHTGDSKEKHDAIAVFMATHGYRLAPCTIDNTDYEFNLTYTLAIVRKDRQAAAKVKADYIDYTAAEIDWYTALNKQVWGYDPPHIMLLHDSLLNAATSDEILALFEKRGYRFVSLSEALKDPAYALPETYITKYGPMWGYRWAEEKHVKVNGRNEPEPPAWINQYVKEHTIKK